MCKINNNKNDMLDGLIYIIFLACKILYTFKSGKGKQLLAGKGLGQVIAVPIMVCVKS